MLDNRRWIAGAVALVVIAGGGWWMFGRGEGGSGEVTIETEAAAPADVRRIVAASGAVSALVTVEVGSQLSGQIAELHVDFNDEVEEGQVIARLDPQTYETRVTEAEAARATAAASLQLQRASLARAQATLREAQLEFDRMATLRERGTVAQTSLDTAQTALDAAQADVEVARAQIANAQAVLAQRDASLASARIDLERTTIRAPINGIVVDRAVDVGQTVAASMTAPVLFTIAQDLGQVQIDAQIDEADIGQIRAGQPVRFTVDAHPDTEMEGVVDQIRLAPETLNNVVTYTVVVLAANPDELLLPGMTANMDIITGERTGVLTVSNAALRFRPSPALEGRTQPLGEGGGGPQGGGRGGPGGPGGGNDPMTRLSEAVGLDAAQQDQIRGIFRAAMGRAMSQAQAGGEFDREALQAEIDREIRPLLDEDQLERYRAFQRQMRETRSATVWVEEADGTLVERPIRVGISDSQKSEVVGGRLEAGEAVVTRAREVRE
ncbi:efflux RND transporter periplasmic adaptor subunit [Maricaulis sp.]|uniref:efflux RND transporter periplasmic adaptor subunit n=1 Tax=Maricaulis sp. TaxID=1486257 RepID=UPI001B18F46B|nr:efflux RND transporter periplasmic adaptor subunit [Maricaulis sp.]MBO6764243.1 efflux RND transporter periplasmic adaptor subunit [Maricaulis sp.]